MSGLDNADYHHLLATWAMELSYTAYNPIAENEAVEGLPGNFREPPFNNDEWTAEADLESNGFEAIAYNYPDEDASHYAAHTIGHRIITEYTTEEANNEHLDNNSVGNNAYMDLDTGNTGVDSGIFVTNSVEMDSDGIERQLVVVSIRGSVTLLDWVIDLGTQFNDEHHNFQTGMKEVIKSLYGCTELCDECNGLVGCRRNHRNRSN